MALTTSSAIGQFAASTSAYYPALPTTSPQFSLIGTTSVTNSILPSLTCSPYPAVSVLSPETLEGQAPQLGFADIGPLNEVSVYPVNPKTWPQIVYCCGDNITIYDYPAVCAAFCPGTGNLTDLLFCFQANQFAPLPGFDGVGCNGDLCPQPGVDSSASFTHTEHTVIATSSIVATSSRATDSLLTTAATSSTSITPMSTSTAAATTGSASSTPTTSAANRQLGVGFLASIIAIAVAMF